jgi:hypothetical protein
MHRLRCLPFALVTVLSLCSSEALADDAEPAPKREFEFSLDGAASYGNLTGFVQIPLGGEPGTTSPDRPTLREMGIQDAVAWEVEARARWHHILVYGGYNALEPDGSGTLGEPLVSHGVAFAAGSPFHSSLKLNVAHFGGGFRFDFPSERVTLAPVIEFALLDFSYSLSTPSASASRGFSVGAARLGGEATMELGHGFELGFRGVASLPISHMPQLAELDGHVSYRFDVVRMLRGRVFLGTGMRWFDFEDAQTVPNRIQIRTGALLRGGLSFEF